MASPGSLQFELLRRRKGPCHLGGSPERAAEAEQGYEDDTFG